MDVSRFVGVFHNEHWLVPFGREVDFPGGVSLANLEIRTDGTASMTMETCSVLDGTRRFEWRWEARPGPRLTTDVFRPGRACWVNRCEEPSWRIEIDDCDGEHVSQCE